MKYLFISVLFYTATTVNGKEFNQTAENQGKASVKAPVKWELVWEDNFDGAGLPDSKIWSYEEGYIRNNEAQYYTKERLENARVENGNLVIEARKDNWNGHKITSASINTYGKKSKIGRASCRERVYM